MKKVSDNKQILKDCDINGPMMISNPWTEKDRQEMAAFVAVDKEQKASRTSAKKAKDVLRKAVI